MPHFPSHLRPTPTSSQSQSPITPLPNIFGIYPLLTMSTAIILRLAIVISHPLAGLPTSATLAPPSHSPPRSQNDLFQKEKVDRYITPMLKILLWSPCVLNKQR